MAGDIDALFSGPALQQRDQNRRDENCYRQDQNQPCPVPASADELPLIVYLRRPWQIVDERVVAARPPRPTGTVGTSATGTVLRSLVVKRPPAVSLRVGVTIKVVASVYRRTRTKVATRRAPMLWYDLLANNG